MSITSSHHFLILIVIIAGPLALKSGFASESGNPILKPVVEAEEEVYSCLPAGNGAGPLWCSGSTCLVRAGERVFASGIETLTNCPPLNNCRWTLFERGAKGWELTQADPVGRTREPSPLVAFPDGRVFLSVNPTLLTNRDVRAGPAQPQILEFSSHDASAPPKLILPVWNDRPEFTEHSYRSFAADETNRELILFQNVGYTHAEWTFRDRDEKWAAHGRLKWPWGADYAKPQPIRVCYPDVVLKDRKVFFCGVSDIEEPNLEWRQFKKQITGSEWDYDFRRLFFSWTEDIAAQPFHDWIELASREKTCGWVSPGDIWVDPDGLVRILWTERALDERLREKFFPGMKQSHCLNYAVIKDGVVLIRRTLVEAREGESQEIPSAPRFQVTPGNRLFVLYYIGGKDGDGKPVSENRLFEVFKDGARSEPVRVPFKKPFTSYFTATGRAGSPASDTMEVLGQQSNNDLRISYGRVRLY